MKSIAVYYKIHEGIDNKLSSENYDNQKGAQLQQKD